MTSLYVAADQQVYAEPGERPRSAEGLYLFALAGWSPASEIAPIDYDLRGGAYWRGLLPRREGDTVGLIYVYPHVGATTADALLPNAVQTESLRNEGRPNRVGIPN